MSTEPGREQNPAGSRTRQGADSGREQIPAGNRARQGHRTRQGAGSDMETEPGRA